MPPPRSSASQLPCRKRSVRHEARSPAKQTFAKPSWQEASATCVGRLRRRSTWCSKHAPSFVKGRRLWAAPPEYWPPKIDESMKSIDEEYRQAGRPMAQEKD